MKNVRTNDAHPGFLSTELANGITHGVGFGLSIVGLIVLIVLSARHGTARHVVACSIYGATLAILYLASTLYHSVRGPKVKRILRIIDHSAIYLLIAGTYTPFTIVTLRGGWGWSLFGTVWGIAVFCIVLKVFFTGRYGILSVISYVLLGCLGLIAIRPLWEHLTGGGIVWLAVGGAAYIIGILFYAFKSIPHHHAIWHVFVMLGSACHYFSIMFFVLPSG